MSAHEAARRAEVLLDLKRPTEALAVLAPALAEDPGSVLLLCLQTLALLRCEQWQHAVKAGEAAVAADPESEAAQRLLSEAYEQHGYLLLAVASARRAVALSPESWAAHVRWAMALTANREVTLAYEAAKQSVRLNPENAETLFAMGYTAARCNKRRIAREAYARALALDPHHAAAHNNLAVLRLGRGQLLPAAEGLGASLSIQPGSKPGHHNVDLLAQRFMVCVQVALGLLVVAISGITEPKVRAGQPPVPNSPWWLPLLAVAAPLVVVAALFVTDRSLPRSLRAHFRRLPATDGLVMGWTALNAVAVLLALVIALPVSESWRSGLRDSAFFVMVAAAGLVWRKQHVLRARRRSMGRGR